jgi:hypothetical protein
VSPDVGAYGRCCYLALSTHVSATLSSI